MKKKIRGTAERPRLSLYRSNMAIYVQVVDDSCGRTLASASSLELKEKRYNLALSKKVGSMLADRAKEKGVSTVVLDRGSYKFHGNIKALADSARAGGLKF